MSENNRASDRTLFHRSSVKVLEDKTIVAAPSGRRICRTGGASDWLDCSEGLPADTHTNRLQLIGGKLFACTNKGLFGLESASWHPLEMPMTCYQYKTVWGNGFAATVHGLWCLTERGWRNTAFSHSPVYDFLCVPQYLFTALDDGIAMYDRMTCTWERFRLGAKITGVSVFRSRLVAVTEHGELFQGNLKGGFERIRYPGMFIFSLVPIGGTVYLCTERGLYRLTELRGQTTAVSVSLGQPVTDLDVQDGSLYLATLSEGIQTIEFP